MQLTRFLLTYKNAVFIKNQMLIGQGSFFVTPVSCIFYGAEHPTNNCLTASAESRLITFFFLIVGPPLIPAIMEGGLGENPSWPLRSGQL